MASRGTPSSRSTRLPRMGDRNQRTPLEETRRSSIASSSSNASKIPTSTSSWFPLSRRRQAEAKSLAPPVEIRSTKLHHATKALGTHTSKSEPSMRGERTPSSQGLGIPDAKMPNPTDVLGTHGRPRNVLRRKASSIDQRSKYAGTESSVASLKLSANQQHDTMSSPETSLEPYPGSVFGVAVPEVSASTSYLPSTGLGNPEQDTSSSRMARYSTFPPPKTPKTQTLPPLTSGFAHSSSSSTRRSESPGSFSRTSTPTSMSSYSPGIPAATKSPLRTRQASPTRSRPPITRRWLGNATKQEMNAPGSQGLSAVRESANSSSSSSTGKGNERLEGFKLNQVIDHGSPMTVSNLKGNTTRERNANTNPGSLQSDDVKYRSKRQSGGEDISISSDRYDTATVQNVPSKTPPPRPSREGTPRLEDLAVPSPVIRSNLSRLETTGHKRRESLERTLSNAEPRIDKLPTSRTFPGRSPSSASSRSNKPTRLPSPNPRPSTSVQNRPGTFKDTNGWELNEYAVGHVKDPSPTNTSKTSLRFGLFPRRTKSPLESGVSENTEKMSKKGPAAGTGHEGYGKYARRGRSGSSNTSASRGRSASSSASQTSQQEEPEMDDFLRERLSPVIISGGRVLGDRNSGAGLQRMTSGASSASVVSSSTSSVTGSTLQAQNRLQESGSLIVNSRVSSRRGSTSLQRERDLIRVAQQHKDDDNGNEQAPTLAARRSRHRSQLLKEAEPIKMPAPINTRAAAPSPMITSRDTIQSSALRTESSLILSDDISEGREGNWLKSRKTEKPTKSPRKWNFFHRANTSQKKSASRRPSNAREELREVSAAISRFPEARSVAHYAMLDSDGLDDIDDMEGLIPSVRDIEQAQYPHGTLYQTSNSPTPDQSEYKQSMLLPSPPNMAKEFGAIQGPASAPVLLQQQISPAPVDGLPAPKESRLPQVGRIPRVISKRDRLHKPPPQSFSRPFGRSATANRDPSAFDHGEKADGGRPVLGVQTDLIPSNPWGNEMSAKAASAPVGQNDPQFVPGRDELFAFPVRKGSGVSGSSSSNISSVIAVADFQKSNLMANEDDIWNEYDELLDNVESPASMPRDEMQRPNISTKKGRMVPAPLQIRKDPTAHNLDGYPAVELLPVSTAPSYGLPSPPVRSNLFSPNLSSSPLSFSEFIAGYGDRNRGSTASRRQSTVSGSHYSTVSVKSTGSDAEQKRLTQIMADKTRAKSEDQSNLRFSALMTSRWLSFGRVLFSPVHNEIQSNKQDRVLVIDGLGNDDWSFYCALTYPDAVVYNLSSFQRMSNSSTRRRDPSVVQPPPNHRQIYHAGMSSPFPFPKGFFTAAVFRFPMATTENSYYNAVSECKRVLRPGGFLEMSILDLDMVNMGNRARRAVRQLKERMQAAEPQISLKPVSDNVQKMLGRRGFENLSRCMVTVPVAGLISDSRAGSFDENERSLGEMLKDASPQGDEGITKMISKVGRWWFTRCYELVVIPKDDPEQSIWTDKALLKECEKRETGLKLLICYAQKPLAPKRRTISL
ncbi:MAG: hypothetical protein LQ351_007196 [Letrouitia transgressa]|nr:MAG: hypothetical protein LQ351_007196 [Letrouitia transgressa]